MRKPKGNYVKEGKEPIEVIVISRVYDGPHYCAYVPFVDQLPLLDGDYEVDTLTVGFEKQKHPSGIYRCKVWPMVDMGIDDNEAWMNGAYYEFISIEPIYLLENKDTSKKE